MPDFLTFDVGRAHVAESGVPLVCVFVLSTKAVGSLTRTDTAAKVGEATGTGYTRMTVDRPAATAGNPSTISFPPLVWATDTADDWPSSVRSVVMLAPDGIPVCAWNLLAGGGARDMSQPHTTETFTPTLTLD